MFFARKFLLPCVGPSQWPSIPHGSVVEGASIRAEEIRVGHLVAFRSIRGKTERVICHRVIKIRWKGLKVSCLTKGDLNFSADGWVQSDKILGRIQTVNGVSTDSFMHRLISRLFLAVAYLQGALIKAHFLPVVFCAVSLFSVEAKAEIVFRGSGPKHQTWTLARGNLNFKWIHPLKILHGRVTMAQGTVKLDPERPGDGIELTLEGRRNKITFEEAEGSRVANLFPDKPWKYVSLAADWLGKFDGGFRVNFLGWFDSAETKHPLSLSAVCQADEVNLKCTLGGMQDLSLLNWPAPKLLWIPMDPKVAYAGEFVFNSRSTP